MGEGPLVLVVEDDRDLQELYARLLRSEGYAVVLADDGAAALRAVTRYQPLVILMDLGLPVIDGWEATRILKRDPRTGNIPIIAITGQTLKTREQDARSAGCNAMLQKPCSGEALVSAVRKFVAPDRGPST